MCSIFSLWKHQQKIVDGKQKIIDVLNTVNPYSDVNIYINNLLNVENNNTNTNTSCPLNFCSETRYLYVGSEACVLCCL